MNEEIGSFLRHIPLMFVSLHISENQGLDVALDVILLLDPFVKAGFGSLVDFDLDTAHVFLPVLVCCFYLSLAGFSHYNHSFQ